MHADWQQGLEDLEAGRYWEAHESWEDVWLELPESEAREAIQALIQYAAACYKVDQVAQGRSADDMQKGMKGLLERAREHLDSAESLGSPRTSWELDRLAAALDRIEGILQHWRSGAPLALVERKIGTHADALADDFSKVDGPLAESPD